jgi:FMN phosphatase YigB (HAD superfamily)
MGDDVPPYFLREVRCIAFEYTTLTRPGTEPGETSTRPVDPSAAEILETLHRRRYQLVMASNSVPQHPRDLALVHAGVADLFTAVLHSHELGVGKPDPRFFEAIARAADVGPELVMYVGNRLDVDVIAATAAGLRAALIAPIGGPIRAGLQLPAAATRIHRIGKLLNLLPEFCPGHEPR